MKNDTRRDAMPNKTFEDVHPGDVVSDDDTTWITVRSKQFRGPHIHLVGPDVDTGQDRTIEGTLDNRVEVREAS